MGFSDDDLKQWQEVARRGFEWEPMPADQIRGILARLETAENMLYLEHNDDDGTMFMCIDPCKLCRAEKAWLRSKGEGGRDE